MTDLQVRAMEVLRRGGPPLRGQRHRYDGPLVRARFRSRPIRSRAHLIAAIPYLDFNPVKAGLCSSPGEYAGGSARHYLADCHPPWLRSERIRRLLASISCVGETVAQTYRRVFGTPPTAGEIELIESRFQSRAVSADDLDYILDAPGARALRWIEDKARNADGLKPALSLLPPSAIEASVRRLRESMGPLALKRSRKTWDGWPLILFGLQNATAGLGCAALAARHAVSVSTASRYVCAHRELVVENAPYAEACRLVAADALEQTYERSRIS